MTTIAVAVSLALTPAAAFADGAGDEQYQDPLAAPTTPSKTTTTQSTTTTPATSAPAATTTPASTTAPTTTASTSTPAASSTKELPRTGTPAGLIGLAGAGLIVVGGVLRRRIAAQ
jgi:LPXTG-motif cell wall-anchored protein